MIDFIRSLLLLDPSLCETKPVVIDFTKPKLKRI